MEASFLSPRNRISTKSFPETVSQGAGAHSQNGAPSLTPTGQHRGKAKAPLSATPISDTERFPIVWNVFFASLRRIHETSRSSLIPSTVGASTLDHAGQVPGPPCPKQPAAGDPALSVAPETGRRGEIVAARGAARAVNGRPHQGPARAWDPLVAATNGTASGSALRADVAAHARPSRRSSALLRAMLASLS